MNDVKMYENASSGHQDIKNTGVAAPLKDR